MRHFTMICGMHRLVGCRTRQEIFMLSQAYMGFKRYADSTLYIFKNTKDVRDDCSPRMSERNV